MAVKSKKFRIALEGATTDGRELTAQDLRDAAETFDPATYQVRVNLEHFRGIVPGGPFDILGDVTALSTQIDTVNVGGKPEKRTALYAEITPLPALIAMNKAGQKKSFSIEIQPDFAKTGRAGLVGLAVTDNPASLGTAALEFAAKNPAFLSGRKAADGNLISEAIEADLEFFDDGDKPDASGFFKEFREFLGSFKPGAHDAPKPETKVDAVQPLDLTPLTAAFATFSDGMAATFARVEASVAANAAEIAALKADLAKTPDTQNHSRRPIATGGTDEIRAIY